MDSQVRPAGPRRLVPAASLVATLVLALVLLALWPPAVAPVAAASPGGPAPLAPAHAYTVTNNTATGPGSLHQAILDANANPGPDTIGFAAQVSGTIVLSGPLPTVLDTLTIVGPGAHHLAVSGANKYQILVTHSAAAVIISGLTIRDGSASYGGAGVTNNGTLTLRSSIVAENHSTATEIPPGAWMAAGIANTGILTLEETSVLTNTAAAGAAGVLSSYGGKVTVIASTIGKNRGGVGGLWLVDSSLILLNSTVSGNEAISATRGAGAVYLVHSSATISSSTIVTNSAATPALSGIRLQTASLAAARSIVAANAGGGNLHIDDGDLTSLGYNLTDSGAGTPFTAPTDITGTNPLIGPLRDNGGPTWTHALLRRSPAIDAGPLSPPLAQDQRGQPRDSAPDIGAYEETPALCRAQPASWGSPVYGTHTAAILQLLADDPHHHSGYKTGGFCGGVQVIAGVTQTLRITNSLAVSGGYGDWPTAAAYWGFDEGSGIVARDTTFVASDGLLVNSPVYTTTLPPLVTYTGQALKFNGINSRVEVTKTDELRIKSGSLTLWFQTTPGANHQVILADERENQGTVIWSYRLRVNPAGQLAFDFTTDQRAVIREVTCPAPRVDDGQWHHAAVVRNDLAARVRLYLDGNQCGGDLVYSGVIDDSRNPLWIGLSPYAGGKYPFEGIIDDVSLTQSLLSPAQVAAMADGRWPSPSGWDTRDTDTNPTVLDALGLGRVVVIETDPGARTALSGLTIQGGASSTFGGGVVSQGALSMSKVRLVGNTALIGGGLLVAAGTAELMDVVVAGNATPDIPILSAGAGIFNNGTLTVTRSTITGNHGGQGGGIASQSSLVLRDSTVAGNSAQSGGGIVVSGGAADMDQSTIAYNTGTVLTNTSGIYQTAGSTVIRNSIVAHNAVTNNVRVQAGAFASEGYNLTNSPAGAPFNHPQDITGSDPLLGHLQWHGGATPTYAIPETSPAAGRVALSVNGCGDVGDADQRGYPRPGGAAETCDIGAYERQDACQAQAEMDSGRTFDSADAAAVQCAVDASAPGGTVKVAGVCTGVGPRAAMHETVYISKPLTLRGGYGIGQWDASDPAAHPTILDGAAQGGVVYVSGGPAAGVALENLIVQRGLADSGAGVFVRVTPLVMAGLIITGNTADDGGGLFVRQASASITASRVLSNTALNMWGGVGGGVRVEFGRFVLTGTEIWGNAAGSQGGGIWAWDSGIEAVDSTVSGNRGGSGGGIWASGWLTLTNSTVSGNTSFTAGQGGGGGILCEACQATLLQTTVTGNSAAEITRSGLYLLSGLMRVRNSIVAANGGTNNVAVRAGSFASLGYNLTNSPAGGLFTAPTDVTGAQPGLGPLAANGGRTPTHALLLGSPAVDRIPPAAGGCGTSVTADQRGVRRPIGAGCDIGAYEFDRPFAAYLPLVSRQ